MNTRQKKKQYKKQYGHNPPRGTDGRYLFHATYGMDLAAGQDRSATLAPEDVERIRKSFCEAAALAAQALADFAAAGYKAVKCRPVDMFPFTAHTEAVCLLERR